MRVPEHLLILFSLSGAATERRASVRTQGVRHSAMALVLDEPIQHGLTAARRIQLQHYGVGVYLRRAAYPVRVTRTMCDQGVVANRYRHTRRRSIRAAALSCKARIQKGEGHETRQQAASRA